jgi:hypothetical protein
MTEQDATGTAPEPATATGPAEGPVHPNTGELLHSLYRLLEDENLRLRWSGTLARLIDHRSRIRALQDVCRAFTAPELGLGPVRSSGRLRKAAEAAEAELKAQSLLWGHITEELLSRAVNGQWPSNPGSLLKAEAMPPWEVAIVDGVVSGPNGMQHPTCTVPMPEDEAPPLLRSAMRQLADIEAARLELLDVDCDHDHEQFAECPALARSDALQARIAQFPAAVLLFGDAVADALTHELRGTLLAED